MHFLLVMPTIRRPNLAYLEPLIGRVDVAVIDDTDGEILKHGWPKGFTVFDYSDRERLMGREAENALVPRKSPSGKNFGLWLAHDAGYDGVITLDDDVDLRVTPDYFDKIPVGREVAATSAARVNLWCNPTGDMVPGNDLVSRGVPYDSRPALGSVIPAARRPDYNAVRVSPVFNQGMWSGCPDINGIDKIKLDLEGHGDLITDPNRRFEGYQVATRGTRLPCSIMNCQFVSGLVPAFYQPPDYPLRSGWRVRRHDDVWSCRFVKVCADIRGDAFTFGEPIGHHVKEGDPHHEAVTENVTNLIQTHFDRCLDDAAFLCSGLDPATPYAELAAVLAVRFGESVNRLHNHHRVPPQFAQILSDYASRCRQWAELFVEQS